MSGVNQLVLNIFFLKIKSSDLFVCVAFLVLISGFTFQHDVAMTAHILQGEYSGGAIL